MRSSRQVRIYVSAAILAGVWGAAFPPRPVLAQVNDLCSNATVVSSLPYGNTVTTTLATGTEGPASTCQVDGSRDVWWSYSPAASGRVLIATCSSGLVDTVLTVFTGTCSTLSEFTCNDDSCNVSRSAVAPILTAGTTYRIRVSGYQGTTGSITLTVTVPPPDACTGAQPVGVGVTPYTNIGATNDGPGDCTCNKDVWFRFTPPATGSYTIGMCGASNNTTMAVYQSAFCPPTNLLACSNDVCGDDPQVTLSLTGGTPYAIRCGSFGATTTGSGNLTISTTVGAGGNDFCSNATVIPSVPFHDTVTTTAAHLTEGPPASCQSNASRDVWWTYTPGADEFVRIDTCGSSFDTVLTIFTGTCFGLIEQACNDNACGSGSVISAFTALAGNTYRIRVSGANGSVGAVVFNISFEPCPTCPGDMNGDSAVDGADVEPFVTCVLTGFGACGCADFNGSGGPDAGDVSAFVGRLLSGICA